MDLLSLIVIFFIKQYGHNAFDVALAGASVMKTGYLHKYYLLSSYAVFS
jgi:hypothetical protein